jgi:hypothetical protein
MNREEGSGIKGSPTLIFCRKDDLTTHHITAHAVFSIPTISLPHRLATSPPRHLPTSSSPRRPKGASRSAPTSRPRDPIPSPRPRLLTSPPHHNEVASFFHIRYSILNTWEWIHMSSSRHYYASRPAFGAWARWNGVCPRRRVSCELCRRTPRPRAARERRYEDIEMASIPHWSCLRAFV